MNLSEDQQRALNAVLAWLSEPEPQTMTLGGFAGTGKTTLIRELIEAVGSDDVRVCAFTGKAASVLRRKGVPASTMHRLIYVPEARCQDCEVVAVQGACPVCKTDKYVKVVFYQTPVLEAELVIVDEASMLNQRLVADLEDFGVKILYVGDHGQLEPIGDDPGLMADPDIRLEQIHRQAEGSAVIQFAHLCRTGGSPATWTEGGDVNVHVGLTGHSLEDYDVVLCGYNRTRVAINRQIRRCRGLYGLPTPGERIICLQNDTDLRLYNGLLLTVNKVRGVTQDVVVMDLVDDDDRVYPRIPALREQFNKERPVGWVRDVALFDFGYAMTTHKSQGSEWENVAVLEQLARSWTPARWRYTAATRASKTLDYFLSGKRGDRP